MSNIAQAVTADTTIQHESPSTLVTTGHHSERLIFERWNARVQLFSGHEQYAEKRQVCAFQLDIL
jgi:hypothetical protein